MNIVKINPKTTRKHCCHSKLVRGFMPIRVVCESKARFIVDGAAYCGRHAPAECVALVLFNEHNVEQYGSGEINEFLENLVATVIVKQCIRKLWQDADKLLMEVAQSVAKGGF